MSFMQSVANKPIMLSVDRPNVDLSNVIMSNVDMSNVDMSNVVAPNTDVFFLDVESGSALN
jgi:hypothetical protein